jgi:hypothetical protein
MTPLCIAGLRECEIGCPTTKRREEEAAPLSF